MNIQPERPAKQRQKYREYIQRSMARRYRVKRVVPQWSWFYDGQDGVVEAWTRSEAKARVKDTLGINNKRLPKEVTLATRS